MADRNPDGTFAKGNPGGPGGNAYSAAAARFRAEIIKAVQDDDVYVLIRALLHRAVHEGDTPTAKLVLGYLCGKPDTTITLDAKVTQERVLSDDDVVRIAEGIVERARKEKSLPKPK